MLEEEYQRYLLIQNIQNTINKDTKNTYELKNILERWLLSIMNYKGNKSILTINSKINQKMVEEMKEKNIFDTVNDRQKFAQIIWNMFMKYININYNKSQQIDAQKINNKFIYKTYQRYIDKNRMNILFEKLINYGIKDKQTQINLITQMLMRYSSILSRGQQWNMPFKNYKYLYDKYNVRIEGFASPLNSQLLMINYYDTSYGSLFYDTDKYFGSIGSFFSIPNKLFKGSIVINPPYVYDIMENTINYILKICNKKSEDKEYVRFFIIMPCWTDYKPIDDLLNSKFLRYYKILDKNKYFYEDSSQMNKKVIAKFKSIIFVIETVNNKTDYTDITKNMML